MEDKKKELMTGNINQRHEIEIEDRTRGIEDQTRGIEGRIRGIEVRSRGIEDRK